MDENLRTECCYQSFGSSLSALTQDVFPSSGVELAASTTHQSILEHFKCCQSLKERISNCFCFPGTQRAVDDEVEEKASMEEEINCSTIMHFVIIQSVIFSR